VEKRLEPRGRKTGAGKLKAKEVELWQSPSSKKVSNRKKAK
jgi:hypothetical protein